MTEQEQINKLADRVHVLEEELRALQNLVNLHVRWLRESIEGLVHD